MKRKDVFTTGQVAQICNVAPRTVTKWFDSGQLKGYRIPGSRDRRIPMHDLIRFMQSHNIPTDDIDCGRLKVLMVDSDREFVENISKQLNFNPKYDVQCAFSSFEAGLLAQKSTPNIIIVSLLSEKIDASDICKSVRVSPDIQGGKVIAMADNISETECQALINKGFDGCISEKNGIAEIVKCIEKTSSILG